MDRPHLDWMLGGLVILLETMDLWRTKVSCFWLLCFCFAMRVALFWRTDPLSDNGRGRSVSGCCIVQDHVAQQVHFCFTAVMVLICGLFYFNMLDRPKKTMDKCHGAWASTVKLHVSDLVRINDVLHSMIMDQEIINHSKPVEKMQNIAPQRKE